LPKDSVANVFQIVSVDKDYLTERVGKLLLSGIGVILGR
jgi:mRNA-degrading endonuclease toxin of MazEF toxin-antitoxin module